MLKSGNFNFFKKGSYCRLKKPRHECHGNPCPISELGILTFLASYLISDLNYGVLRQGEKC